MCSSKRKAKTENPRLTAHSLLVLTGNGGPWQSLAQSTSTEVLSGICRLQGSKVLCANSPTTTHAPAIFQSALCHKGALALHGSSVLVCKLSPGLGGGAAGVYIRLPQSWHPPHFLLEASLILLL